MLRAPATSLRRQIRLAVSLSWVGGYVNVVALLHTGVTVSHMTGNVTRFGQFAIERRWHDAAMIGLLPLSLLLGAFFAGLCEQRGDRRSRFVLPIALEAAGLAVLSILMVAQATLAPVPTETAFGAIVALAAIAMGLQNATITRISGATVRTTHLTGVITDLGTELAALLFGGRRRRNRAKRRVALLASIVLSFAVGVAAGAIAYERRPALSLVPPTLFLLALVRQSRRPRVASRPTWPDDRSSASRAITTTP